MSEPQPTSEGGSAEASARTDTSSRPAQIRRRRKHAATEQAADSGTPASSPAQAPATSTLAAAQEAADAAAAAPPPAAELIPTGPTTAEAIPEPPEPPVIPTRSPAPVGPVSAPAAAVQGRAGARHAPDPHRALPESADSEKGLLCSALLSPKDVLQHCLAGVQASHFADPALRAIYETIRDQVNRGGGLDYIALSEALAERGQLERVGGKAFLAALFTFVPTAANADWYLEIVRQKHVLRQIISVCTEGAARAYEQAEDAVELLGDVERKILAIGGELASGQEMSLHDRLMGILEEIDNRQEGLSGLATGYPDLDEITGGLQRTDMIVIAARPSMGKTALAMNIADHVAVDLNKPVAIFSLEMSANQVAKRLLFSRARVDLRKSRDGIIDEAEFRKLTRAIGKLSASGCVIDDSSGLSITELRAKARRMREQKGIELVVIDYLQLLCSKSARAQENRQQEISEISQAVKAMAKELNIPVVVLSQLNRQPEGRGGGKPRLSDLRESGSIEQDADLVSLLVRPEMYEEDEDRKRACEGEAELIVAKHRNGPVGTVSLSFLKEFARFESRTHPSRETT